MSKSLAFGRVWQLLPTLSIASFISLGINKLLRLRPICIHPKHQLWVTSKEQHRWQLVSSESSGCIRWNKWKHCESRKSGQTPTLANPNSFPLWAPGDHLSPNGERDAAEFLQASQLVNKRLHSSCSPLVGSGRAEISGSNQLQWPVTRLAGREWWLLLNEPCKLTLLSSLLLLFSHSVVSNSFVTSRTVAHHGPLSTGFSRPGYWSGLPFLPPGDLPDPGSPALAGGFFTTELTREALFSSQHPIFWEHRHLIHGKSHWEHLLCISYHSLVPVEHTAWLHNIWHFYNSYPIFSLLYTYYSLYFKKNSPLPLTFWLASTTDVSDFLIPLASLVGFPVGSF